MQSSLNFIELITGRLAQTFSELNQTIRQQIKRRQSENNHQTYPNPQHSQIQVEPSNAPIQQKMAPQQKVQESVGDLIKVQDEETVKKPQRSQKPKPKKVLVGHRPRKVQNAFKFYLSDMKKKNDGEDPGQITKIASKKWEIMAEQEKQQFIELQEKQKKRYQLELEHFYDMNPEEKQKDMSKKEKKQQKKKQKEQEKDKQSSRPKRKQKKQVSPGATPKKQSNIELAVDEGEQRQNENEGIKKEEQRVQEVVIEDEKKKDNVGQFLDLGQQGDLSDSLGADI